jgi:hypothetical protein
VDEHPPKPPPNALREMCEEGTREAEAEHGPDDPVPAAVECPAGCARLGVPDLAGWRPRRAGTQLVAQ